MNGIELVTVRHHNNEYDEGKCPPKDDTECYQRNRDIDKCGDDIEEK